MKFVATFLLWLSATGFAAEEKKCPEALDLFAELEMTADYHGENWDDIPSQKVVLLKKGETYSLSGDITLIKERKGKCEYEAGNLSLENTKLKFKWSSKKKVPARIEYDKKGNMERFHLNGFKPSARRKKVNYDGERYLYLGTTYDDMDDTSAIFKGPLAYFDFGDGHEYFGRATVWLRQD